MDNQFDASGIETENCLSSHIPEVKPLNDFELALIGGGGGDVVFA